MRMAIPFSPTRLAKVCVAVVLWACASWALAVDVNLANEAELDSVRGLGPDSTARILKARDTGVFKDWADLMKRVKGIRTATAQRLSDAGLTVNGLGYPGAGKQAP